MKITDAALDALRREITAYCEENQIFGMLRITEKDRILLEANMGYANVEKKEPFDARSAFTLYSLSKPFCVLGLLKLADEGLVDMDAHPATYVPEACGFDARVTLRHLVHHVSGLPDAEQISEFAEKHAPGYARYAREHVKLLTAYPQYFEPGTATKYANINMILCALVIENVTGLPYADYMQKEVFEPLGMQYAVVDNEELVIPHRVQGYALVDGAPSAVEKSHHWSLGAGDIVATVDDVYTLNRAIKHGLLVSEDTWREVLTPYPINRFGMGCTVSTWHGKRRITHNGGHTGFRTLHVLLPEDDLDVIFLSNSGYGNARDDIMEMIHTAFWGDAQGISERVAMDKGYI